jgi:uncharacterized protein YecE (DUF72 family)
MMRIGVAGWEYADWVGTVYPAAAARRLDRLVFLSRYVDVIEINSTFYRPAAPRTAESWLRRTQPRGAAFTFTAKAHRCWTHQDESDLGADGSTGLEGLRVLRDGGKLAAMLLQFPQSFRDSRRSRDRLRRIAERLADWPVTVELRHAEWLEEAVCEWFDGLGLGWCVVDQPRVGHATAGAVPRVARGPGYLRLHGRNAANWFREGAGRDSRYDYLYSAIELEQLGEVARQMATRAEETIVVQNNHFRGKALVNALQLKHRLQGLRPPAPDTLVAAYPELEPVIRVERSRLF